MNRVFKKLVREKDLDIIFNFAEKLDYEDCMDILDEAYNLSSDRDFRDSNRNKKRKISL